MKLIKLFIFKIKYKILLQIKSQKLSILIPPPWSEGRGHYENVRHQTYNYPVHLFFMNLIISKDK